MATATYTTNYHWIQPALSGDPVTWGSELNTSLGSIDSQVKANDQRVDAITAHFGPNTLVLARQGANGATLWFNNLDAVAGQQARWVFYEDAGTEGGNANSNLVIQAYNDAGAYLGWAMQFTRSTQRVAIALGPVGPNDIAHKGYVDTQVSAALATAGSNHGVLPIGSIIMWPTGNSGGTYSAIPTGWVQCFGQHYKISDYPQLANAIGGYWFWDGTNFGVPNLLGKVPVGHDGTTYGTAGYYVGLMGGEATHQISIAEMPGHDHAYSQTPHGHNASQPAHSHSYSKADAGHSGLAAGGAFAGSFGDTTGNAQPSISVDNQYANIGFAAQGGWAAHNNMQPYAVLTFLIRYA